MRGSEGTRLAGKAAIGGLSPGYDPRVFQLVAKAIEDGLVETLGTDLALAVRVCLKTSFALTDPLAYASALVVMLVNDKSDRALERITTRIREVTPELRPTISTGFSESILALRGRYSAEALLDSK